MSDTTNLPLPEQPHSYQTFVWSGWTPAYESQEPADTITLLAIGDVRIPVALRGAGTDHAVRFEATSNIAEQLGERSGIMHVVGVPMDFVLLTNGAVIQLSNAAQAEFAEYILQN